MTPRWLLISILFAAGNLPARIGTVDTFTQERFTGHIRFESNLVVVANAEQGLLKRVALTNLAGLHFQAETASWSGWSSSADSPAALNCLPAGWTEETIGGATAGGITVTNGLFRLRCAGTGPGSQSDSCRFINKPVRGDSETVVRVVLLERGGPMAGAGLMIRQTLDADSPGVGLFVASGARAGRLVVRAEAGQSAMETPLPRLRGPGWLKLRRDGKAISAWSSGDGRRWRLLQRIELPLREEAFVGVAAWSDRADREMRVSFDELREGPSLPTTAFIPRLELQSGSVMSGPFFAATGDELRFPEPLAREPVLTRSVANIRFQWVPERWNRRVAAGKPGVLLRNGEFVEGDFQGIDRHHLVVSSVLMGLRRFDVNREVVAAVLRPSRHVPASCEVRDAAGSLWLGSEISLGDNEVVLREATLGVQRIPLFALTELRRR